MEKKASFRTDKRFHTTIVILGSARISMTKCIIFCGM